MRKTKIIATLGPASWDERVLRALLREGVDALRINFAHGDPALWENLVKRVRSIKPLGEEVALIGDLQGPVVRLGDVEPISAGRGEEVTLVLAEKGSAEKREVPIPYEEIFRVLEEGDVVLIESGRIALTVEEISDGRAVCRVTREGIIQGRKTFAIKGKDLPLPTITEKDMRDLRFAARTDFDYVSLSFVRDSADVERVKRLLGELGASDIRVIAKVETRRAVERIEEIAAVADALLVARGDLAIYFNLEEIPRVQSRIVLESRRRGKPVIIATQLLDSMVESPMPTRSEVVDIITAVREGVDALMLANETAVGRYPIQAVSWLKRIIVEAEKEEIEPVEPCSPGLYELVAKSVVVVANFLEGKIVAYSGRGNTARRISLYRPKSGAYVLTQSKRAARQMRLMWGIIPVLCDYERNDPQLFEKAVRLLRERGCISYGDIVVFTAGLREGATDIFRAEHVAAD